MVNAFSRCEAVFEVSSMVMEELHEPAAAKLAHEQANGAHIVALWLLNQESVASGKPPRRLADFAPYVDGVADVEKTRLLTLYEANDADTILAELKKCEALSPIQENIIQAVRDQSIGR